jgi:cell division protein FtsL
MNRFFIIVVFLVLVSFFFHFYNKHVIFQTARENLKLEEMLETKRDLNRSLVSENIKLCSLARIESLAMEKLEMEYPEKDGSRHTILYNETKQTFSLLDFFIPTAEALVRN